MTIVAATIRENNVIASALRYMALRHELLVMYYENLDDTGYIIGERDEMGRADLPAELAASIKERSLASFQILAPSN